jgi:hypothetical protein
MLNQIANEGVGLVGAINPDVTTASTVESGWIDASVFQTHLAVVSLGTLGSSATVDAKLEQASDGSGTGVKDITGKAITQLTQAGTDASDSEATISLRGTELDLKNDFTHFRLSITVGTATSDMAGYVFGIDPRTGPATDNDAATVLESVN